MKPSRISARPAIVLAAFFATLPFLGSGAADFVGGGITLHMDIPERSIGGCNGVNQYIALPEPVNILGQSVHASSSGPAVDTVRRDYGLFLLDDFDGSLWYYWMYGSSATARCLNVLVDHIEDTATCAMASSPQDWIQWAGSLTPKPNVPGIDGEPIVPGPPCDIYWTP